MCLSGMCGLPLSLVHGFEEEVFDELPFCNHQLRTHICHHIFLQVPQELSPQSSKKEGFTSVMDRNTARWTGGHGCHASSVRVSACGSESCDWPWLRELWLVCTGTPSSSARRNAAGAGIYTHTFMQTSHTHGIYIAYGQRYIDIDIYMRVLICYLWIHRYIDIDTYMHWCIYWCVVYKYTQTQRYRHIYAYIDMLSSHMSIITYIYIYIHNILHIILSHAYESRRLHCISYIYSQVPHISPVSGQRPSPPDRNRTDM